jgi:hypothetical protein
VAGQDQGHPLPAFGQVQGEREPATL